jgi:large subunit ribosomal protein L24
MPTTKRFAPKLHIKNGDKVRVIAGSNKGQEATVKQVFPSENRAILDGVNLVTKHIKAANDNPGGINQIEAPIHISNLMLIDPKSGKPTKIGRKIVDGKSQRYSKKSGEIIK